MCQFHIGLRNNLNPKVSSLFDKEKFREDLYFRINVIRLSLPHFPNAKRISLMLKRFIDRLNDTLARIFMNLKFKKLRVSQIIV